MSAQTVPSRIADAPITFWGYPIAQPGGEAAGSQPSKRTQTSDCRSSEHRGNKGKPRNRKTRDSDLIAPSQPGGESAGSQQAKKAPKPEHNPHADPEAEKGRGTK